MYRVDVRPVGALLDTCYFPFTSSTSRVDTFSGYPGYESIYSFRTRGGRNPVTDVRIPDFSKTKSAADRIRQMGNFYRDFSESATASSAAAFEEGSKRSSTGDTGHEMLSVRVVSTPLEARVTHPSTGRSGPYWLYPFNTSPIRGMMNNDPLWAKYSDASQVNIDATGYIPTPPSQGPREDTQAIINQLFSKMRADAPVANIGETLVELIKGGPFALLHQLMTQWDSYLKLLRRPSVSTRQLRDLGASAGGSYLYGSFAVTPFVNDVKKVIDNLTVLHTLVYGSSSRMRRIWEKPTTSTVETVKLATRHEYARPDGRLSSGGGSNSPLETIRSVDTRLVSRFSGLARPTSSGNEFIDRANALWYNLGMTEPDLVWNLTSFSWLLDWWLHLGTSITNAFAFSSSGVNVDYAYATTKVTTLEVQRFDAGSFSLTSANTLARPHGQTKRLTTVTYRRRATPFGFGGDLSSLSSGQMSILTALGLVKTR